jgi:hypothetical protein
MQPAVTNTKVSYTVPDGVTVTAVPKSSLPAIFIGERLIVYAILHQSSPPTEVQEGSLCLSGDLLGAKVEHNIKFQVPAAVTREHVLQVSTIHHLAAKKLIKEMELDLGSGWMNWHIIQLSCDSNVISSHTAFIAIDEERKEAVKGSLETWDILPDDDWCQSYAFSPMACSSPPGRVTASMSGGGYGGGGGVTLGASAPRSKMNSFGSSIPKKSKHSRAFRFEFGSNVISSQTAFIAIDEERKEAVKGSLETWDIQPDDEWCPNFPQLPWLSQSFGEDQYISSVPYLAQSAEFGEECMSEDLAESPCSSQVFGEDQNISSPPYLAQSAEFGGGWAEELCESLSEDENIPTKESTPTSPLTNSGGGYDGDWVTLGARAPRRSKKRSLGSPIPKVFKGARAKSAASAPSLDVERKRATKGSTPTSPLTSIINLQLASGAWKMSAEMAGVMGKSTAEIKNACPVRCDGEMETIWATVIVLMYLQIRQSNFRDEWELIAGKAQTWLTKQNLPEGCSIQVLREKAMAFLS